MKFPLILLAAGLVCGSCNNKTRNEVPSAAAATFKSSGATVYRDDEFSPWMTKAEQQVIYDNKPAGQYFADTEGRNLGGLNQYRHVLRPFPQDKFTEWAVYWGLNAEEFYQLDLKLLRAGYTREHLQVFVDRQGVAFHQAVWLKAKQNPPDPKPAGAKP